MLDKPIKGTLLDTAETALNWTANITWNGLNPIVELVDTIYPKGIKVTADELELFFAQWQRSDVLPKWDITISPT